MTFHNGLFILGNLVILPFWALMILAPRWRWTERIMRAWLPLVALAALYVVSLLASVRVGGLEISRLTLDLDGLAYLLGGAPGAATAWLHLIAFDLFVGRWMYLEGRSRVFPAWALAVALFFTLLTGPFGLLLYLLLRRLESRQPISG